MQDKREVTVTGSQCSTKKYYQNIHVSFSKAAVSFYLQALSGWHIKKDWKLQIVTADLNINLQISQI